MFIQFAAERRAARAPTLWSRGFLGGRLDAAAREAHLPCWWPMTTYNIIVISHLFTHAPPGSIFDVSQRCPVSALNSFNIGQSVQAYQLTHVRNHHRYNNDRKGAGRDARRTHPRRFPRWQAWRARRSVPVRFRRRALNPCRSRSGAHVRTRLWRVGEHENTLRDLAAKEPGRKAQEVRQIQIRPRSPHFMGVCVLVAISWKWVLLCYLPAFDLALALVNVQNYYEHYGALPEDRYADSVSYYGRLYNVLAFNDGYHQEHHLRPQLHWSHMPDVRREHKARLDAAGRIVSPVPAIVGFLDWRRPLLHRGTSMAAERS